MRVHVRVRVRVRVRVYARSEYVRVCVCSNAKAGPWSMEEIEQLIDAMETIPYGKWARVQQEKSFHHRSQVCYVLVRACVCA